MPKPATAEIGHNRPPTTEELMRQKHPAIFERLKTWLGKAKRANLEPQTLDDCTALDKLFADGRDIINDANTVREKEKAEPLKLCKEIDGVFNVGVRDEVKVINDRLNAASAARRLAITRAQQEAQAAEAERLRKEAEKRAEAAAKKEEKGQNVQADVDRNRADALHGVADSLETQATADVSKASQTRADGVTSSVKAELVCVGIDRSKVDLEALRPFLKEDHIIEAVGRYLKMGNKSLAGAAIEERAKANVRR